MFMNAGDQFAEADTLARIALALRASPGVDLLFGGTILALPSGRRVYRPPHPASRIRLGLPAYHQATVIRRAAHLTAPYRPFAIRACHANSLSERATRRRYADFIMVQRQVLRERPLAVTAHVIRLAAVDLAYRLTRLVGAPDRLGQTMYPFINLTTTG